MLNYLYWPQMSLSVVLVGNMWVLPSILNRLLAAQTQAPAGVGRAGEWAVLMEGLTCPFFFLFFRIRGIDYAYFFVWFQACVAEWKGCLRGSWEY